MDKDKIRAALKAATHMMVVEVWSPPVGKREMEKRFKAREDVQKMCLEALAELDADGT